MLNHDCCHCFDFKMDCPGDCYRAQLERDLDSPDNSLHPIFLSYAHLEGTKECKRKKGEQTDGS